MLTIRRDLSFSNHIMDASDEVKEKVTFWHTENIFSNFNKKTKPLSWLHAQPICNSLTEVSSLGWGFHRERLHWNFVTVSTGETLVTSLVSSGKWTVWNICVVWCWIASTSTWWGGLFLWPCWQVFFSFFRQSAATEWRLVKRNCLRSPSRIWLQLKSPVANHMSCQPCSSDPWLGLSVSCFIIWQ